MIQKINYNVFKTTNLIDNKIYVARSQYNYPKYLGSGRPHYKNALKKYGRKNFRKEILEYCNSFEDMCKREKYWIIKLDSINPKIGYNKVIPTGEDYSYKWTDEMKQKHSEFMKKYWSDPENRKKLSEIKKKQYLDHPKWKKEHSKRIKNYYIDHPKARDKASEKTKKQFSNLKEREKMRKIIKKYFSEPKNRKKQSEIIKKYYIDHPESRKKASEITKKYFSNTENRKKQSEKLKEHYSDPENRKKVSKRMKKYYLNIENKENLNKYHISKDELYNLYIIQNKTQKEISDIFGCSDGVICRRLKKYNIKKYNINKKI